MLDTVRKTKLFRVCRTIYQGARRQMFGDPILFDRIVKGYGVRDAALPTGIHRLRRSWMGHRDRGVGSTKRRQAVMTMSCELELLLGRPYDLPGCAASADP